MKRVIAPELLDVDAGTPDEVASALRSLRLVNTYFGGVRMHRRLLRKVLQRLPQTDVSILEVASGHAHALQGALPGLSVPHGNLHISLLDQSAQHLPGPGDWDTALPAPQCITGDALQLPFADASVDVVSCCLFAHHLDEPQLRRFVRESLRVARLAVLINDLERTRLHYMLAKLFSVVDPSRLSKHDGPVSVRRAYTRRELPQIIGASGFECELVRGFLFRVGVVVWKR